MATPSVHWSEEGFAAEPDVIAAASGNEVIYRAFGGTSRKLGNCFFAPVANNTPIAYWTADLLERELNASLWGNDFERLAKFRILKGVRYKIGEVAHDRYMGTDDGKPFYQRAFITPSGIFSQITFYKDPKKDWREYVQQLGDSWPVKSHRYAREAARRAKRHGFWQ